MRGCRALANSAHLGRKRLPLFAEPKIYRACLIKRSFSFPAREQSAFMKAVVQNNAQLDANSLRLADDQPVPTPDPEQVLIKVAYAGVNRPDLMQRRGLYPPPSGHSPVLGLEVSGTVVAAGVAVTDWKEGDQVCALTPGGGYAEYCVVDAGSCLPIPDGLGLHEAAALPEACFTVWANVFELGRLQAGETILVHGGTSGVGSTAVQLAKARGARVFVTCGSAEKCARARALGADLAIDYSAQDFLSAVKAVLPPRSGVDVVLDMVGGDYISRNLQCLGTGGRHVSIAFQKGSVARVDFLPVMLRSLVLTGSTLRPRSRAEKARIARELRVHVWPLVAARRLEPLIHATLPLKHAARAHHELEQGTVMGKFVLEVEPQP